MQPRLDLQAAAGCTWGDLHNTAPNVGAMKEGGIIIIIAVVLLLPPAPCPGDAVFCCGSESSLFGPPKEDTTRNQWLSYVYNTVPEQFNPNIRVCAVYFTEDCFLNLEE